MMSMQAIDPVASSLTIEIAGQSLRLCAQRALIEPATATLMIADAHFGKAAAFRAHGVPVPEGVTQDDLARLDALIEAHGVRRIVFLGDFFHARESLSTGIVAALARWRLRHAALPITLVLGNHDRHAGPPPALLDIRCVEEPYRFGPWALCHHPQVVADAYVLAGHEHPAHRLKRGPDSVLLPCFRFDARMGVLPAFGGWTGLSLAAASSDAASAFGRYVIAGDRVFAV